MSLPTPSERAVVCGQLGREPRGRWRVCVRCRHGFPQVVATSPRLGEGEPFPTLFWLTCPFLKGGASEFESEGGLASWRARLSADPGLAERVRAADRTYREMRGAEAEDGVDPCVSVGVAGQADPLKTKCLHAHVAAFLAGVDDPLGEEFAGRTGQSCDDSRCGALTCLREE